MESYEIWAVIFLAAAVHGSFALSVSMLTLMSGHALGKRTAQRRVLRLSLGFLAGVITMIALCVSLMAFILSNIFTHGTPLIVWSAMCGLMVGVGVAVWSLYYRHKKVGTVLWLPRPMAKFLSERSKATKSSAEAFSLGLVSVIAELLFAFTPMLLVSFLLIHLDTPEQLLGLTTYTVVAALPLIVIIMLVGGGHSLGKIQKWREKNKRFLQFAAGSALIILGGALYVMTVVASASAPGVSS